MVQFVYTGRAVDLGLLPYIFNENDERPAREQAEELYAHGGGWRPFKGFKVSKDGLVLTYPGDPPMHAIAYAYKGDEKITVFDFSWVMITQKDGTHEISRMD